MIIIDWIYGYYWICHRIELVLISTYVAFEFFFIMNIYIINIHLLVAMLNYPAITILRSKIYGFNEELDFAEKKTYE